MGFYHLIKDTAIIFYDNQSAIQFSKHNVYYGMSKNIYVRYHFSKEGSENGDIEIKYLESHHILANILTKALPEIIYEKCV